MVKSLFTKIIREISIFHLLQLNLGRCQGDVPPGTMITSYFLTWLSAFSPSAIYTKSNILSDSKNFF